MKFNIHIIYVDTPRDFALEEDIFRDLTEGVLIDSVSTNIELVKSLNTALAESDVILTIGDEYHHDKICEIVKVSKNTKAKSYNFKDEDDQICARGIKANGQSIISIADAYPRFIFNEVLLKWLCTEYNLPLPQDLSYEETDEIDDYLSNDEILHNEEPPKQKKKSLSLPLKLIAIFIMVIAIGSSGFLIYDGMNRRNPYIDVNVNPASDLRPPISYSNENVLNVIEHFGIINGESYALAQIAADYNDFLKLTFNGESLVRNKDYEAEYGSTIITLLQEFIARLDVGTHTFIAEFAGGKTAIITLTIPNEAESHTESGDISTVISQATSIPEITSAAPPSPPSIAPPPPPPSATQSAAPPPPPSANPPQSAPAGNVRTFRIFNQLDSNRVLEADAITLVARVIEAEMGSHWPLEALRAQAVAAYSYLRYHAQAGRTRHLPARSWANTGARARQAAQEMYGTWVMHNGRVAETMFFAMSAGVTTSSQYVWGGNKPYLQSVSAAHENASNIPTFNSTVTIPANILSEAIRQFTASSANHDTIDLLATVPNRNNWLHLVNCPTNVYVSWVYFGTARGARNRVRGNALRMNVLTAARVGAGRNLRSHAFTVTYNAATDSFTFAVRGFGHGVGLSQEGARVLANQGRNYRQILQHYFRGIAIVRD